ncbi:DUF6065 family protein [Muricoccus pecuniae]|uniref:Uncharacterized protein n=1 Tax=Muricoccus pecuniae TaxID=693023 RepID=A0A840YJ02_9PROT|nr:DUF6065 family protein [Roseomonas pecuniae]MBB5696607.1 hypothetical protein [Roseomonas pecuniae]
MLDSPSLITFHRVLPGVAPRRAGKDAGGTLPHRAAQYCLPSSAASSFGYLVFLPTSFSLIWDGGTDCEIGMEDPETGEENWYPFQELAYPGSFEAWDAIASEGTKGYCPSWITATEIHGLLQIWTGWFVSTSPGHSLLVRAPANLPRPEGFQILEGIVETDRWFGPLFTNIRLLRTGRPIRFDATRPFLQVQPLPREVYADATLNRFEVGEAPGMPPAAWDAYEESLVRPIMHGASSERGRYARAARKRAHAEMREAEGKCPHRPEGTPTQPP